MNAEFPAGSGRTQWWSGSRRRLLWWGLSTAAAAAAAACSPGSGRPAAGTTSTGSSGMNPTMGMPTTASSVSVTGGYSPHDSAVVVPPAGPELSAPRALVSRAGNLTFTMRAEPATVNIGLAKPIRTYTYDGALPGYAWEVRPGDTMNISLVNDLPPLAAPMSMDMTRPHEWTNTNLHTHGLHVSPSGNSDNVFLDVPPGGRQDHRITLPHDHPAGLFWYHPHRHGAVCQQVRAGMAGALIVRGDIDDVPEIKAAKERLMVVQAIELGDDNSLQTPIPHPTKAESFFPRSQIQWTVNGRMNPTITLYPGEVQRWRILNAAEGKFATLRLAGHEFAAIAYDGLTIAAPSTVAEIALGPANRIDVLLRGAAPGTYQLVLQPGSSQHPGNGLMEDDVPPMTPIGQSKPELMPRTLATVVVRGAGPAMKMPTRLPVFDPPILPIAATRTVKYTVRREANGEFISFGIDGKPFDPAAQPYRAKLGTAEEWTVVNDSDAAHEHSFHIHVNPFKVIKINGKPVTPMWRDTFTLPSAEGGSFTFQTNFKDFTGKFVEHCHVLAHEDLGMMEALEVVK